MSQRSRQSLSAARCAALGVAPVARHGATRAWDRRPAQGAARRAARLPAQGAARRAARLPAQGAARRAARRPAQGAARHAARRPAQVAARRAGRAAATRALGALTCCAALVLGLTSLPGCNLISVGTLVAKRFAPALGKGDKEALKRASSPRLAGYWDAFTEQEIQAAVGVGPKKGRKAGQAAGHATGRSKAKKKAPSVGLVSFKVTGQTAILVVRQGAQRFRFLCLRTADGWKVDNVFFRHQGKPRELSKMLQVLVAAKTLQRGLEQGSRYLLYNVSTPRLREQVFQQLRDDELEAIAEVAAPVSRKVKGRRGPPAARIESEDTPTGFLVRSKGGSLPAELRLVEKDGQILVDSVSLQLGGSWHTLGDLLEYFSPAVQLLRWVSLNLRQGGDTPPPSDAQLATLLGRLEGFLSERLWRSALGWLTPADLRLLPWTLIRGALVTTPHTPADGSRPVDDAAPSLGLGNITRFEQKGDRLDVEAKVSNWRAGLTFLKNGPTWRLDGAWLDRPGQRVYLDALLSALGPLARLGVAWARLSPELSKGPARGRAAIEAILGAVRLVSSKDANRRLWSRIPETLIRKLPLEALPSDLLTLLPRTPATPATPATPSAHTTPGPSRAKGVRGPGAAPRAAARAVSLPRLSVEAVHQTPDSLRLELKVAGRPIALLLVREPDGWKLDDLLMPLAGTRRSLKAVGALVLPAVSLAQAVLASDAQALRQAMTPLLRRDVVDPLLAILGPRFASLMRTIRESALPGSAKPGAKGAAPADGTSATKARPGATGVHLTSFDHDEGKGRAEIALTIGRSVSLQISLTRDSEGHWAIADIRFPLAGREVTLARVGPVLGPLLGFGLSLLGSDLGGVRRASSSSFNAAAWKKLSAAKFKSLVKQLTSDESKSGAKARPRGAGPGADGARPKGPPQPKLVALRIRDDARWPWAQVELDLGGRRIMASLVKERGKWKVHDLEVQLGSISLSIKKLIALGL